jgi:hypothetical protein
MTTSPDDYFTSDDAEYAFACPLCGGREFLLTFSPPLTEEERLGASAADLALLASVSSNSPIIAHCAQRCAFKTSVTNIESNLASKVT